MIESSIKFRKKTPNLTFMGVKLGVNDVID